MPRIFFFICCGVLLTSTQINAQLPLPRNPTMKQVIGYQLAEQRQWNYQQVPRNSVFYKMDRNVMLAQTFSGHIPKDKPYPGTITLRNPVVINAMPTFNNISSFLREARVTYSRESGQSFWRNPQNGIGASILRDIIIANNR